MDEPSLSELRRKWAPVAQAQNQAAVTSQAARIVMPAGTTQQQCTPTNSPNGSRTACSSLTHTPHTRSRVGDILSFVPGGGAGAGAGAIDATTTGGGLSMAQLEAIEARKAGEMPCPHRTHWQNNVH